MLRKTPLKTLHFSKHLFEFLYFQNFRLTILMCNEDYFIQHAISLSEYLVIYSLQLLMILSGLAYDREHHFVHRFLIAF